MKEKEVEKVVELTNLGKGAVVERFNDALEEVFLNCMDINTIQKKMRKIKLEVSFLPNEERNAVGTQIKCETVLAGANPVETLLFIGKHHGKIVGIEHNPEQQQLFQSDEPVNLREVEND